MLRFLTLAFVLSFASNAFACAAGHTQTELSLNSIAAGTDVKDRRLIGANDTFEVGAPVWVHIAVHNPGPEEKVTMIWYRDDDFVWEMDLDIGTSSGWRTWTRMRMPATRAGKWSVAVLDQYGDFMGDVRFDVVGKPAPKTPKPAPIKPPADAPVEDAPSEDTPTAAAVTAAKPAPTAALIDDEPGC